MKKILALTLPLMFLALMTIPAGKAVTTPIEVVRANGICFFTMRGDYHDASFLFHYVNLSPKAIQTVILSGEILDESGIIVKELTITAIGVLPGDSINYAVSGGCGWTFSFYVVVVGQIQTVTTEVIIPPPPLPVKIP